MSETRGAITVVSIELDEGELAARIAESIGDVSRPPGVTAVEVLQRLDVESRQMLIIAVRVAFFYFHEQLGKVANARLVHGGESGHEPTRH